MRKSYTRFAQIDAKLFTPPKCGPRSAPSTQGVENPIFGFAAKWIVKYAILTVLKWAFWARIRNIGEANWLRLPI